MIHKLKIDSVQLSFGGRTVLSSAFIGTETGKISALLGRNGTGKSCLFRIATGMLKTENVSTTIDGHSYFYSKEKNKLLTSLPQYNFIPNSLCLARILENFDIPQEKLFDYFPQLHSFLGKKLSYLSGGERRLVEVCTIIFSNSLFSILDEPFSELSPIIIEKIKDILQKEKQRKGIIITDHLYKNVLDISDDTYVLHDKNIYKLREPSELTKYNYLPSSEF